MSLDLLHYSMHFFSDNSPGATNKAFHNYFMSVHIVCKIGGNTTAQKPLV